MKKLVALLLVLGFVATANAGIILQQNGTDLDEITIGVSTTISLEVNYTTVGDGVTPITVGVEDVGGDPYEPSDNGEITDATATSLARGAEAEEDPGVLWSLEPTMADPEDIDTGVYLDFDFHCLALGDAVIVVRDGSGNITDSILVHQVPEPMTIALLGLGGLLLRRRR